jgi:hypothetical protein
MFISEQAKKFGHATGIAHIDELVQLVFNLQKEVAELKAKMEQKPCSDSVLTM